MGNFRKSHMKESIPAEKIDYLNLKLVIIVYAYFHAQIKYYFVEVNINERVEFIFFNPKEKIK